jgi:leucyl-tRNA synthetase
MFAFEEEGRDRWIKVFEVDPEDKVKLYLNVAYPYPSGAMHVGHGRTYIVPDVIARFWRMKGRQVLYPMAFHVTGTPVIGISRRIAQNDIKTIELYRDLYRVPEDILLTFIEPREIVRYFSREYERVMQRCGLSIDWRRRFTTVDPQYSKFIEWQYLNLQANNHVVRGAHPVKYCPQCDNPVGDHDLLEGVEADIIRFVLIMFAWGDWKIPCATLRPETTYGVTNLWVNPEVTYVKATVDRERWILSREAAEKIRFQDHDVEIVGEIPGSDLIDELVSHPFCGDIPVLSATFVNPEMATGIVMSVPAHAPFDYIALRDLQDQGKYRDITLIPLISVGGYGTFPAKDVIERAKITDQNDPAVEDLTQEVYNAEFTRGVMLPRFGGKPVREAREEVASEMVEHYGSVEMYEFDSRPVVCRCGGRVYVRILHDQWFLQYSDPEWKERVHALLNAMELVPPEVKAEFDRTVDWLKDWACTRRIGLGTRLPWDTEWLVEPLSDSTIYMAYYTIAHHLRKIDARKLTPEVFDYLFKGIGAPDTLNRDDLDKLRDEFLYWYPYDFRFSAKDLISNHLTFQLFHHTALFPEALQPRGMVVFGMGLLDGAKMSSSKGNVVLLEDAIDTFGADTVRMFLVGSAEPWQDFDWRSEFVTSTKKQIERFWNAVLEGISAEGSYPIDRWLQSRIQQRIAQTAAALESFQTRQAIQEAYFGVESDLKWYRRRLPGDVRGSAALRDLFRIWVRLMAPFIPFTCEKLWQEIGEAGPVALAEWPDVDPGQIDISKELSEDLLARTVEDIESIIKLIKIKPAQITLFVAPDWKFEVFRTIARAADKKTVIREIMANEEMRARGRAVTEAAKQITNLVHRLPPQVVENLLSFPMDEIRMFEDAAPFLEQEFGVPVSIVEAGESSHPKAAAALPFKPAIVID